MHPLLLVVGPRDFDEMLKGARLERGRPTKTRRVSRHRSARKCPGYGSEIGSGRAEAWPQQDLWEARLAPLSKRHSRARLAVHHCEPIRASL